MKKFLAVLISLTMILCLAACGSDEVAVDNNSDPVASDSAISTDPEYDGPRVFESTDEVTYDKLMELFTSGYLLERTDIFSLYEEYYSNGEEEASAYSIAAYKYSDVGISKYRQYRELNGGYRSENWYGYTAHDTFDVYAYGSDDESYEHWYYANLDSSYYTSGLIVPNFSYVDDKNVLETIETEDGLYQTTIEYNQGGVHYSDIKYIYSPITGVLSCYLENAYYGSEEPTRTSLAYITMDDVATDFYFDPQLIFPTDFETEFEFDGETYTVHSVYGENLYFAIDEPDYGVYDYHIFDESGAEIDDSYSAACFFDVKSGGKYKITREWFETYPEYVEDDCYEGD